MLPMHGVSRYLSALLLVLPFFVFSLSAVAENNDTRLPTISIELWVVPEKEACKPHGYKPYDSDQDSNCRPLYIRDIEKWIDIYEFYGRADIPPSEVKLGYDLVKLLNEYKTKGKSDPNKRQSIVLVFDWKSPQNLGIKFERVVDVPGSVPIIDMKWDGKLAGERRWIHHERLDAFHPGYNIEWTLTAGGHEWKFTTKE